MTILDALPYVVTVITCYVTIRVCLSKHDLMIGVLEKKLDDLSKEVKANNEVKLRVTALEGKVNELEDKVMWLHSGHIDE